VASISSGGMEVCVLWMLCVIRQSMLLADRSYRGVLLPLVHRCVWSRKLRLRMTRSALDSCAAGEKKVRWRTLKIKSEDSVVLRDKSEFEFGDLCGYKIYRNLYVAKPEILEFEIRHMVFKWLDDSCLIYLKITKKTKLRDLSPRANYTDRAAAAGRRS
jgi:hypothetical protein